MKVWLEVIAVTILMILAGCYVEKRTEITTTERTVIITPEKSLLRPIDINSLSFI